MIKTATKYNKAQSSKTKYMFLKGITSLRSDKQVFGLNWLSLSFTQSLISLILRLCYDLSEGPNKCPHKSPDKDQFCFK